jgi:hypothetical protein
MHPRKHSRKRCVNRCALSAENGALCLGKRCALSEERCALSPIDLSLYIKALEF